MEQTRQTVLSRYIGLRDVILETMHSGDYPTDMLWQYQEIVYRISIIETCQTFLKMAPVTTDARELLPHYHMLTAFFSHVLKERRFGLSKDPEAQKQQDTAYDNVSRIVEDHKGRFRHYAPHSPEQYQKDVNNIICTVLPAWMQYRDSLLSIRLT